MGGEKIQGEEGMCGKKKREGVEGEEREVRGERKGRKE